MEKTRRRGWRKQLFGLSAIIFAASFIVSLVPSIRAIAEGAIFKIKSAEITQLSSGVDGAISSHDDSTIVSDVTFHKLGDTATYKVVLQNTDSKDHVIETISDDNANSHISYSYDKHANETIAAGANLDFIFEAKYAKTPNTDERQQVSKVKFSIRFTDIDEPEEVIVAPSTYDGLGASFVVLAISSLGLIVCAAIYIKNHKKAAKVLIVALVAALATAAITSVKAATVEVNSFTLTTNYGFYDKLVIKDGDKDVVIDYGEKLEDVDEITEPTKTGYTFAGWEDENGNPVDPTKPITEDTTIKPKFTAHTYTIKFNGNGANGEMADLAMTYDEAKTLPANAFNFLGHTYTGWDTEANGSGVHYDNEAEVKNLTAEDNGIVTLYAQWSINPFHIDYDGNGATSGEMATTNCEYDQACQLRDNAFEKYGYDFAGWKYNDTIYTDKAGVTNIIDHGTITMQAQWTPHVYTITYTGLTNEEATALRTAGNLDNYTIETTSFTLIKPADRKDADGDVREHCIGWRDVTVYEDVTLPIANALGNKTYEAVWQTVALEEFDITYDYDGGNVATANPTKLTKEQSATLNEPTKTGYTFTGWTGTTISGDTPVKPYTIPAPHQKGNLEYTAHYRANTYTVNFDINTDDTHVSGTMQPLVLNYDEEKPLTANAFTRTGYTFAGWKDADNNEYTDGQTVKNLTDEDCATVTLKAQWSPIHYNIAFHQNADNVSGNMSSMTVAYDESTPLTENTFALEHYKFMGWNTKADGTGTPYEDKASVLNLTAEGGATIELYAVWNKVEAIFNSNTSSTLDNIHASNSAASKFKKYPDGQPSDEIIATATDVSRTDDPIWVWPDGENIYFWSEDPVPSFPSNMGSFFLGSTMTEIDLNGTDADVTSLYWTFVNAYSLKKIDFGDNFDTKRNTNMSGMFGYAYALETIEFGDKFSTENVTDMSWMFNSARSLKSADIASFDVSKVKNMSYMFTNGGGLEDLDLRSWNTASLTGGGLVSTFGSSRIKSIQFGENFNTNNVTSMANTFYGIRATSLDVSMFNTEKVTTMAGMFSGSAMTSLNLSNFSSAVLQNMDSMFKGMGNLTSITFGPNFTAEGVTNIASLFDGASSIEYLDLTGLHIPAQTSMSRTFMDMHKLKTLDIAGWDLTHVTNTGNTFANEKVVETIYASSEFLPENLPSGGYEFGNWTLGGHLVGGAGTACATNVSGVYARIDDPDNGNPGYFTYKNARYIRYHDNDEDDTNDEANYALMKSHYLKAGDSLKKNAFARDGYVFNGWKDADNNEYTDEQVMTDLTESKTPLELYAQWKEKSSTLQSGTTINQIMRNLNADATSFRKYPGTPTATTLENAQRISTSESNYPAYMWNDGDTLYWWSEAEKVYLSNGSSFFNNMQKLETIDVAGLDTSKVKVMRQMFMNCYALTSLDLSTFNTSAVTDMANMFSNDTSLTSLNVTSFDTSKVGQMNGIFQGFAGEVLDLSSFDTSSVGGNVIAFFSTTSNLKTVYVGDKWTTTNVDIPSTTPLVGGAGSTSGGARLDNPDNNSRGRLSKKDARYIRYNGNGAGNATPYGAMTSEYLKAGDSLKKNAFVRSGYVFTGWKDADNNEYIDEQVMADLTESKTPLELYAQWDAAPYTVTFDANGGEVLQGAKTVKYLQPYGELPTPVRYDYVDSMLGGKYSFKEWNTKADGTGDTITSSSIYENTDDTILYAIWNDQFTVTIYNGESETPTIASYGIDDIVYLNAQNVAGKQFLYWEVDGAKKAYNNDYSMRMFQGKDLTIRAIYGSESDLENQQPGTYISDIYRQYSGNKIVARSYSYVPDGYEIVKAGVVATLDANIANGTFDDQTATYPRTASVNGSSENYYFTWTKSNVTSEDTVYVKAYLIYKDADGVEHTIYGDLVTATLTE